MECFTVQSGINSFGVKPKACAAAFAADPERGSPDPQHAGTSSIAGIFPVIFCHRACCGSESRAPISTFGNSHRCAFTTPAGRCRTRNFPLRSMTKAMKRRAVAAVRRPRFGNSPTRFSPKGDAKFFYRANLALRVSRRADQCAEFHEGLVEVRAGNVLAQSCRVR